MPTVMPAKVSKDIPVPEVNRALSRLNTLEKIALTSGKDFWSTVDIPAAGIPSVRVADGPHCLRSHGPSTVFPTCISMGASWDPALIERAGQVLGEESAANNVGILLGPCINIVRHPLNGRNFETMSEDPFLTGQIGTSYVNGVQSRGVGTSVKHFACNNWEIERARASAEVGERALREIYLPAFELIVKHASPWTIMCSYNRINGIFASANYHLLTEILKREWGYDGVVMSDWTAVRSTLAMSAGIDLEMPGPAKHFGTLLAEAVYDWQVEEACVAEAARRMIGLALRWRRCSSVRKKSAAFNTVAHQELSRTLAEKSITLLKNDNAVLPIDVKAISSIAVIGPSANHYCQGGGSSRGRSPYAVTFLDGLKKALPSRVKVRYAQGCSNQWDCPRIPTEQLTPASGKDHGITMEIFPNLAFESKPAISRTDKELMLPSGWPSASSADPLRWGRYSARWTGFFTPVAGGTQQIQLGGFGDARVFLDGALVAQLKRDPAKPNTHARASAMVNLVAGKRYRLKVEYVNHADLTFVFFHLGMGIPPSALWTNEIRAAQDLARVSECAIVCVGNSDYYEHEGDDRPHMELTGAQNALVDAILSVNPRTVVVLNVGSPVTMPWADRAPAIILAYYPGMEGGNALARILTGAVNPSGRLPVTFPRSLADAPSTPALPNRRTVRYGEDIMVGYRHYDTRKVEPLFAFGHGLSYSDFSYAHLRVSKGRRTFPTTVRAPMALFGDPILTVTVTVRNAGTRAGEEVVQLYIADLESSVERPAKELKGFARVSLKPGESKTIALELDKRAFSFYDEQLRCWVMEPGAFELLVGSSSRDVRLRKTVQIR